VTASGDSSAEEPKVPYMLTVCICYCDRSNSKSGTLLSCLIKSRRLRWAGYVAWMGESRSGYRVLVGRPEGRRPLGRPRPRWGDNITMDLREVWWEACLDWSGSV
jgi:hypothetical protein